MAAALARGRATLGLSFAGTARTEREHGILEVDALRYSVTFRSLSP